MGGRSHSCTPGWERCVVPLSCWHGKDTATAQSKGNANKQPLLWVVGSTQRSRGWRSRALSSQEQTAEEGYLGSNKVLSVLAST